MRVVVNEFMSLDGVVQAPGGAEEDTEGGFAHGGWSMRYFDPEVMGPMIDEGMRRVEALLFGRSYSWVWSGDDGLTLVYEYAVNDPVYLAEPFSHRIEMARLPGDTPVYPFDCDVQSASQFSRD